MDIIGRVTRDAQIRAIGESANVVNFSVAVNDSYKNRQGERVQLTEYFDCSYWLGTGVAKLLTRGQLVELTGRVSPRVWLGADGQPRAALNFRVAGIKLHGGRTTPSAENNEVINPQPVSAGTGMAEDDKEDLPF